MPGESQQVPESQADPSVMTQEAIVRAGIAQRDYVNGQLDVIRARLNGMDEAAKVLHETVVRVPTDVQQAVGHLKELTEEKFSSVDKQFAGRDEAVKAAFSAQEKQALAQDAGNQKAIDKSEKTTLETIKTNQELSKTTTDAIIKTLDELKLNVAGIVASKVGATEQRTTTTQNLNALYGVAGFVLSLLLIGGLLAATGAFTK